MGRSSRSKGSDSMKRYSITFNGRKVGAIGIFYTITAIRVATDKDNAILALYDEYEHITRAKVIKIKEV